MHCRYKFVDISYLRAEEVHKGKVIPEHTEHVVMFLPDVWTVVPAMMDYLSLQESYKHSLLVKLGLEEVPKKVEEKSDNPPVAAPTTPTKASETPATAPETPTTSAETLTTSAETPTTSAETPTTAAVTPTTTPANETTAESSQSQALIILGCNFIVLDCY